MGAGVHVVSRMFTVCTMSRRVEWSYPRTLLLHVKHFLIFKDICTVNGALCMQNHHMKKQYVLGSILKVENATLNLIQ